MNLEIEFVQLTLKNFLSYGNNLTVIPLKRPGTTLILGEDLDRTTEGTGANGVGKSTIINALTYALYDKPISNISKDNLVNNINKKNMEVTVEFNIGDNNYVIKRERKTKAGAAGNNVYLFINGEDKTLDSTANTNKFIEDILGIEYDLFVRIVVFFASHIPFLDLSKADQSDMFERLVGLTTISFKASLLKDLIKETEGMLQIHKAKIGVLEKEKERHTQQLANAKERIIKWRDANATEIAALQAQLTKISGIDLDQQQALHEELALINSQLTQEVNLFEKTENRMDSVNKQIKKLKSELVHLQDNKCPYCLQQYADAQAKIEELIESISNLEGDVKLASQDIIKLDKLIDQLETARDDVKSQMTITNIREMLTIRSQSDGIEAKIETLKNSTNPHFDTYEELTEIVLDPINYEEINKLTKELEHQKFLLKLLTKKDSFVRKALLNKYIPFLNNKLQEYLSELGLPHKVEFTHEMTANISQFGRTLDFGNLSAGQRARVNLSLSLAFRDVLQHLHAKINVCMLDEVLDIGLDAVGAKAAARILKQKARDEGSSVYIISHRDEVESMFDNTLVIQLIKGFSYIKDKALG